MAEANPSIHGRWQIIRRHAFRRRSYIKHPNCLVNRGGQWYTKLSFNRIDI